MSANWAPYGSIWWIWQHYKNNFSILWYIYIYLVDNSRTQLDSNRSSLRFDCFFPTTPFPVGDNKKNNILLPFINGKKHKAFCHVFFPIIFLLETSSSLLSCCSILGPSKLRPWSMSSMALYGCAKNIPRYLICNIQLNAENIQRQGK